MVSERNSLNNTLLELFKKDLPKIEILGHIVYLKKWHDNIIETYDIPNKLFLKISSQDSSFSKLYDKNDCLILHYYFGGPTKHSFKLHKVKRQSRICTLTSKEQKELDDFKYSKRRLYILLGPIQGE